MRGDLHIHTTLSDGSLSIEEVIAYAKTAGLNCIAISDHDSIQSFSYAQTIGWQYGISVLRGVEFSCYDYLRRRKVHILCYQPNKPEYLLRLCEKTTDCRKLAGNQMAEKVLQKYPIPPSWITRYAQGSRCIYKQHIMHALMDGGYTDSIYGELYQNLFSDQKDSLLTPVIYPDVREALDVIHAAGGLAVLAHPGLYDSFDFMCELIAEHRLDGLEVWHPKNKPEETEYLLQLAKRHQLLTTGGSDFHGMYHSGAHLEMGCCTTPPNVLEQLLNREGDKKEKEKVR